MKTPYGWIYVITNQVNGKRYVGQTRFTVRRRFCAHIAQAVRGGRGCFAISAAIKKYGAGAFTVRTLCKASLADLNYFEARAIDKCGTLAPGGYNLTTSGYTSTFAPDARARMSASQKIANSKPEVIARKSAAQTGKTLTPEHRAKVSAAGIGRVTSDETRAKLSVSVSAAHAKPEVKAKKSAAQVILWKDPAVRAKRIAGITTTNSTPEVKATLSARLSSEWADPVVRARRVTGMKGVPKTDEHKAALSAAKLGRPGNPHNAESRRKISEGNIAAWAPGGAKRIAHERKKAQKE